MKNGEDAFSKSIVIDNVNYTIKSCCNGEYLCIKICIQPNLQGIHKQFQYLIDNSLYQNFDISPIEIERDIIDGKVVWFKYDKLIKNIQILTPIAEEIAKKTDELLHKVSKMKAFI